MIPFVDWVEDKFFDPTTVVQFGKSWNYLSAKKLKLHESQKEICSKVLTPDENGIFPYSTVVYSTIKKEGKTTLAGAVGAWWADQIEAPNLILTLANDKEQSAGRIFGAMLPTMYALGARVPMSPTSKPEIILKNGTIIQAIANNYSGAAGANYGLTLWSELWAYATERSRRLYDELVPVPTRKNSLRWIETYAGFEDESDLLLGLFLRIFKDTSEKETQPEAFPVPGLEHITTDGRPACWHIPSERLFVYWNHTPRMPWNLGELGDSFRRSQKADLRLSQYVRLWENRWQSSEGNFLDPEWVDDSISERDYEINHLFLAGDASQRNDTTALVGVEKVTKKVLEKELDYYIVKYFSMFDPREMNDWKELIKFGGKKFDLDLEATILEEVKRLHELGLLVGPFHYDPYQLHQLGVNLRKQRIPASEFDQGVQRVLADTHLWKVFKDGRIVLPNNPKLIQHVKNAKAKEMENELVRIVKGTASTSNKVDAAVALSMAVFKASKFRPTATGGKTFSMSIFG